MSMLEETVAMTREAMPGIGGISSLYMYNNARQEKTCGSAVIQVRKPARR